MPDTSHLTARAREVFQTYLNQGRRDIEQTANLSGMSPNQVDAMVERYGFVEMARDSDMQRVMALAAYTRRKLAEQLPVFADTLIASATSRTTEAGNTPASAPTPSSVKSALAGLAMFGLSPLVRGDMTLLRASNTEQGLRAPDDALVARLIEAGDTVALTALAAGRPLPVGADPDRVPGEGVAPRDFTSDQPGGRVGSGPVNPLFEGSVTEAGYRVLSDEEWSGEQGGGEEFAFGEQPDEAG